MGKIKTQEILYLFLCSICTYNSSKIETAVYLALENKISNTAGVKHILLYIKNTTTKRDSLPNWQTFPDPDTSVYAQLGRIK